MSEVCDGAFAWELQLGKWVRVEVAQGSVCPGISTEAFSGGVSPETSVRAD